MKLVSRGKNSFCPGEAADKRSASGMPRQKFKRIPAIFRPHGIHQELHQIATGAGTGTECVGKGHRTDEGMPAFDIT
ncbi:hypothetical protein RBH48_26700, partial [Escherichia coli]|uniref:hypothetical protein n=1 Tax=Escherichia coli TaxID=562 RepID=UPI002FC773C3